MFQQLLRQDLPIPRSIMQLALLATITAVHVFCKVHYYIKSSMDASCPQDPCVTIFQFSNHSSGYVCNEVNVSLYFLPGNHELDNDITVTNVNYFCISTHKQSTVPKLVTL